ncbi:MAG: 5-oxoprolinase [Beijerinckiaceae bacterium]|nr:MAG: 5-oxoprolinase [Beijerinckiaceae bacterium]
MVGKLNPDFFPAIFGPRRDEKLDVAAVQAKFAEFAKAIPGKSAEEIADGFIAIAVMNMANAIKKISVERGYDVTRYALNCFGGAGGQHACLVADHLGMTEILIHPYSGLLSAYGMGLASIRATRQMAFEAPLGGNVAEHVASAEASIGREAVTEVAGQGVPAGDIRLVTELHLRYAGTDSPIEITWKPGDGPQALRARFETAHRGRFGFTDSSKQVVIEAISVEAIGGGKGFEEPSVAAPETMPKPGKTTRFFSHGAWQDAGVFLRADLTPGARFSGPAILIEPNQTIVVEPGWEARVTAKDHVVLKRREVLRRVKAIGTEADPILLEIFNNLFMSIAEQMGVALQNTAYSVNIKERLDFSCAVFDQDARLVANAPHMPVHLGSMDRSVESIIKNNPVIKPGDVYAINAPYNGGTHLPDITVCTPVFDAKNEKLLFWVASRGHHADIGGIAPGSMSPLAMNIEEEGVYIDNFKLVDQGEFREEALVKLLTGAKYPVRNVIQNVNDLKAQIAANAKGVAELEKMIDSFGLDVVQAYMGHVQDNAAESVARVLAKLHDSSFDLEMDQGCHIRVKITVNRDKREATVDFTGTSPQRADNFNAPEPVTRAAVLYVFRIMVEDMIPMNAGCLRPIHIIIPEGTMLTPAYPAAVVAGNVEVSQGECRSLAGGDELPDRRAWCDGLCTGHDEQPHLRQQHLPVLRNHLFRLSRRSGLARHARRSHPHDQLAADRPGNPRVAFSRGAGGFPHPPRLGRCGPVAGRGRHASAHPLSGADGMRAALRASPRAALRARGRIAGPRGQELGAAALRGDRDARRLRPDRARSGRGHHHRNADAGGIREGIIIIMQYTERRYSKKYKLK